MPTPTTTADKAPAHALWVELSTRITTQRLHYRSGEEETAADSVFKLFGVVRGLMDKNAEARAFQELGLSLLNDTLRTYTARWHGWMTEEKRADGSASPRFKDEWVRRQFRRELRELQPRILGFREACEAMKEGLTPDEKWTAKPLAPNVEIELCSRVPGSKPASLGCKLTAGIRDQVRVQAPVFLPLMTRIKRRIESLAKGLWFGKEKMETLRQSWKTEDEQRLHQRLRDAADRVEEVNGAERFEILKRRGAEPDGEVQDAIGLAFSGGGIRSATYCLGITQVLARRGLLPQFDYLSTVSGGGYFGSFLSAYLGTGALEKPHGTDVQETAARIRETFIAGPDQREPRAVRHLRNSSRYLLNGEFWAKTAEIGMVLAGVLFNLLIILPFPILGALLTKALYHAGFFGDYIWTKNENHWLPRLEAPASICLIAALIALVAVVLSFPVVKAKYLRRLRGVEASRCVEHWQLCHKWTTILAAALLLWWLTPLGFRLYHEVRTFDPLGWLDKQGVKISAEKLFAGLGTALTTLFAFLAARKSQKGLKLGVIGKLAIFAGPALYIFIYLGVGYRIVFANGADAWSWEMVCLITAGLLGWAWLLVDVNTYSPHGYYRDRLCSCYLLGRKRADPETDPARATVPDLQPRLRLTELNTAAAAPYHLVNAAVNLPSSTYLELRGRAADFFVFSKHWSGGPVCGYYPTKDLEAADPHLDLGTAMAISGAAASSNMGWMTSNSLRLVMTLANVRLGYWMRNPALGVDQAEALWGPGPSYLFREMFAKNMDEKQNFLNLSDGAHIENLGAYELMRRRCKFIVCVDGGQEGDMNCVDLLRLERLVSIDLGIRLHYDLKDVTLLPSGHTRAYGVMVKIDYNPPKSDAERQARSPADAEWGWMLYLKLATTGTEPGFVMDYKRQNPAFPHQSTGDQIYDEAQFEAYRELGEFAAESMFRDELVGGKDMSAVESWFKTLVSALLPDNDEVFRP